MGLASPRGCPPGLRTPQGLTLVPLATGTDGIWPVVRGGQLRGGDSVAGSRWSLRPLALRCRLPPQRRAVARDQTGEKFHSLATREYVRRQGNPTSRHPK